MDLRARINEALKEAMRAKQADRLSVLRLASSAIKDRDIAARGEGQPSPVPEAEVIAVLSKMVKQRQESARAYAEGGREDLAAKEQAEVAVIEEFVAGTEIAVAVVDRGSGPEALPGVEIRPESGVYDYTARYTAGATRFLCPAEVDPEVAERSAALALRVQEVLGLRDLSRTDLIVTPDGEPTFLEVNVSPGMTETSSVPLAIEAADWSLGKMCADLVRTAAARASLAAPRTA